jgi:E3 ubiquitin-protein ligase BRE1
LFFFFLLFRICVFLPTKYQRIEQRKRTENELRARIDQLESRQTQDDAVLNAVNRYWNQFNEDIRILLQRFDAETTDEQESKNESEVTMSFLAQLSTWDKKELDENLANRVQISKRAVGKIIQVFDRLMQRNDKIVNFIQSEEKDSVTEDTVREQVEEMIKENRNLQEKNMELHSKNHTVMLNEAKLLESLAAHETAEAEMKHKIDGLEYELEKVRCRNDKLENHLAEAIEKIKNVSVIGNDTKNNGNSSGKFLLVLHSFTAGSFLRNFFRQARGCSDDQCCHPAVGGAEKGAGRIQRAFSQSSPGD